VEALVSGVVYDVFRAVRIIFLRFVGSFPELAPQFVNPAVMSATETTVITVLRLVNDAVWVMRPDVGALSKLTWYVFSATLLLVFANVSPAFQDLASCPY